MGNYGDFSSEAGPSVAFVQQNLKIAFYKAANAHITIECQHKIATNDKTIA